MYTKSLIIVTLAALVAAGCSQSGVHHFGGSDPAKYIVVFKNEPFQGAIQGASVHALTAGVAVALAEDHEIPQPEQVYSAALNGGLYTLEGDQADELASDPRVAYVEKDQIYRASAVQTGAPWGLDRIDQAALPLNQTYNYDPAAAPVNAYVIDTGILTTHQEFQGRASSGYDFVDKDGDATDCNGHGTHVAGTIGGATYGVAKNAKLIAVRVLDCDGSGNLSDVIAGIEWVTAHHVKPAVANMSLGGGASQAIDDAVAASIQAGVTYVVAAGNENTSACNGSPSRVPQAITVGATTSSDARASFSNYGSCVDVFAPGNDIQSAWFSSTTATSTISGTSMASPHVAGVAALYLSQHPSAAPSEVAAAIVSGASPGKLSGVGSGSPNLLVNALFSGGAQPSPNPAPNPNPSPNPAPDPALKNGIPVNLLSGAKGSEKAFTFAVPAASKYLVIAISGSSGDADLYVRFGNKPTASLYDCRPYLSGSNETCTIKAPRSGTYYVSVKGYSAYSGVSLKASYQ